jgi:hypothetical protein
MRQSSEPRESALSFPEQTLERVERLLRAILVVQVLVFVEESLEFARKLLR